jgi:hypothetical protein
MAGDERVAVLEANRVMDKEQLDRLEKKLDGVKMDISVIKENTQRQKGFMAGVLFVVLPLWSIITIFVQNTWDKLTGN